MPLAETYSRAAFEEIRIGRAFHASEAFDYAAMDRFAALSGDYSPIHTNTETARLFGFQERLQYGFLLATLVSRIVGTHLQHAICASVALDFAKPVLAGRAVDVRAEVTQIQEATRSVVLRITMTSEDKIVGRGKLTTVFLRES